MGWVGTPMLRREGPKGVTTQGGGMVLSCCFHLPEKNEKCFFAFPLGEGKPRLFCFVLIILNSNGTFNHPLALYPRKGQGKKVRSDFTPRSVFAQFHISRLLHSPLSTSRLRLTAFVDAHECCLRFPRSHLATIVKPFIVPRVHLSAFAVLQVSSLKQEEPPCSSPRRASHEDYGIWHRDLLTG